MEKRENAPGLHPGVEVETPLPPPSFPITLLESPNKSELGRPAVYVFFYKRDWRKTKGNFVLTKN